MDQQGQDVQQSSQKQEVNSAESGSTQRSSGVREVIIIGSGPAGYTAGIYMARAELAPLMFAGEKWGGQLMLTTEVENYPGFSEGILGPKLMEAMRGQAKKFRTEIIDKNVTKVDFAKKPFKVWVGQQEYQAKAVVVATGAESRLVGVPGEKELLGRGVSTCAVCDAPFYKGKKQTYVVGGGDAAVEEALALAKYAEKVTMIHRRDQLKASKIMQRRVKTAKNIDFLWNSELVEVKASADGSKAEKIVVKNITTNQTQELVMDGIFIAIGHKPMTEIFKGQLELDAKGYLVTHLNSLKEEVAEKVWLEGFPTETSVAGVFGAGDVVDFRYRQAVTAAGFGTMAALDVEKFLTGTVGG